MALVVNISVHNDRLIFSLVDINCVDRNINAGNRRICVRVYSLRSKLYEAKSASN